MGVKTLKGNPKAMKGDLCEKTLARVEPNSLQLHVLTKPVCDYMHSTTAHSDLEVREKAGLFMVQNFGMI